MFKTTEKGLKRYRAYLKKVFISSGKKWWNERNSGQRSEEDTLEGMELALGITPKERSKMEDEIEAKYGEK